jgi:hypothetical protein
LTNPHGAVASCLAPAGVAGPLLDAYFLGAGTKADIRLTWLMELDSAGPLAGGRGTEIYLLWDCRPSFLHSPTHQLSTRGPAHVSGMAAVMRDVTLRFAGMKAIAAATK